MSNIFVIGATGGIGKRLCPMLVAAGHSVSGLARDTRHEDWYKQNQVTMVEGDLMDITVESLTELTKDADVIIFSAGAAGSGKERTTLIDGEGPLKVIGAMRRNQIKRLYLISVFPEAGRTKELGEGFEHYMSVKKNADVAVVESELDWVILRPGTLLNEEGDGSVSLAKALAYSSVKRGNVAKVLATLVEAPHIKRDIFELTDGDHAVDKAVASLASPA